MAQLAIPPLEIAAASTTDQVFDALYDAIVSLKLEPGAKVSESEIAAQLNVSRQPVRDVFFRLSKLGLIAIRPQRATLVTRISEAALVEAVFVRTALEVECLRAVIAAGRAEDVAAFRREIAAQERAAADPEAGPFHALDEAFHAQICTRAGHPHAWALIRDQKAHMDRVRYLTLSLERRQFVLEEHRGIVDAIAAGEAALADARLRAHLGGVLDVVGRIRDGNPEYFEPPA
ncbi:GntR family transcriptional regulator [Poseidonocella sedimentorum]|uniref:DNA-binding transcriptional regulator, GntR family n=1 Tax=Poseidonocella sedimentorum TaxID=871652 RepID=A0A1I6EPY9_9RHOB|nr:GntR family transcriptional regulator [Poseidonocella sedimentorum]SFR19651.1 DNA-binding transcriptional regulator, GntR family [Poseidonocella sedimentorum]